MSGDYGGYSCGGLVLAWLWVCATSGLLLGVVVWVVVKC
jgi:hypothetical protein